MANKPILGKSTAQDVNYRGATIKGGVHLWQVGTDTAKSQIYGRLRMATSGPGCMHFYIGLGDEYFCQLTAEKLVTRYTASGYPKSEWVNVAEDKHNEALDCEVYALAAAHRAGLPRTNWSDLERAVWGGSKAEEAKTKKPTIAKSKWMDR
jgi:phage terminase large subunit GpA-like protein